MMDDEFTDEERELAALFGMRIDELAEARAAARGYFAYNRWYHRQPWYVRFWIAFTGGKP